MLCSLVFFRQTTLSVTEKRDTINTGPRTRGRGTQGPEDPRTGDPRTRGPGTQGPRFLRAVLDCSSSNTTMQAISANATCLTHNYVLYVVAMHTEGVIYSRQRYSLTSLILRVVYCRFCKARLAHRHDTQSDTERESLETIRI